MIALLHDMVLARAFEERAAEEYTKGNIAGFLHLYPGEEAVAVGVLHAAEPSDYIVSTYREHVHVIVRGIPPNTVMAELFGKQDGCCHGMGDSMHLFDRERRFNGLQPWCGGTDLMSDPVYYWQALNPALDTELAADDAVFVLGEDVGLYGGSYRVTEGLHTKYGEWRLRDTPISEGGFTGLGVGAALLGMRPVVEIMTINFALLALDAIINMAAKIPFMSGGQFPMPLVVPMPGGVAKQLAAQHSQRLEQALMNVPGLRIAVPATPQDAWWQLRQAIRSDEPIILLEHELLYFAKGPLDMAAEAPPMHRAKIHREGSDLSIVTYSRMLDLSLQAASQLSETGIEAEVIDLRSLRPIDWDTCRHSLEKTHRLLVVEEDSRFAGTGAEVVAGLTERAFYSLDAAPERVAARELPTPYNGTLEAASIPRPADIVHAAKKLCAN